MNNDRLYSGGAWEKLKVIGRGGSSIVYKGEIKQTGKYVAVKEVMTDGMSADQMRSISGEVDTMKLLDHENIVRCFGLQQRSNKLFIFLEYCDRGSLRHYYQKHGALPELQTANAMLQILRGLQYLHSHGIAHRDVKGANVLLNKQGTLKLADFGASKKIGMESLVSGLKGVYRMMINFSSRKRW
jgi:cell division control protein CDC15